MHDGLLQMPERSATSFVHRNSTPEDRRISLRTSASETAVCPATSMLSDNTWTVLPPAFATSDTTSNVSPESVLSSL
ncbi:hypothetical protein ACS0PU_002520 [Formica fusca]